METSLKEQFPDLPFARGVDGWLTLIKSKNLLEQLKERRVRRIRVLPMLFSGALGIQDGDFIVYFNDVSTPEKDALALGHEIGHTFHFNLTETPPKLIIPDKNEISDKLFDLIENFCTAFSVRWLEINGRDLIEKRCRNERMLLPSISTVY